ncbi:MAG: amidohydrolase, partial [Lysobacteraceae bacterium]
MLTTSRARLATSLLSAPTLYAVALSASILPGVAGADALIDNVNGITLDKDGKVVRFTGLLMSPDGKVVKLLAENEKRPAKLDWRADEHGKVLLPGFIDAHGHVME